VSADPTMPGVIDESTGPMVTNSIAQSAPWPPQCDLCQEKLDRPGALVFSPPEADGRVNKLHVCMVCWLAFCGWIVRRTVASLEVQPDHGKL